MVFVLQAQYLICWAIPAWGVLYALENEYKGQISSYVKLTNGGNLETWMGDNNNNNNNKKGVFNSVKQKQNRLQAFKNHKWSKTTDKINKA